MPSPAIIKTQKSHTLSPPFLIKPQRSHKQRAAAILTTHNNNAGYMGDALDHIDMPSPAIIKPQRSAMGEGWKDLHNSPSFSPIESHVPTQQD
jgi:hypothetical protein